MKMTLILTALISTLLGLNLAFAQSGFNPRDPNLETLDGQYVDQYATPKDDPKTAEAYGDKYFKCSRLSRMPTMGGRNYFQHGPQQPPKVLVPAALHAKAQSKNQNRILLARAHVSSKGVVKYSEILICE
jgi:hypothetical protein